MRQAHPISVAAIIVGVIAVVTAVLGLCYNAMGVMSAMRGAFNPMLRQNDLPYFYPAFFIMSGICVFCYVVLLVCGVDLIRSRLRWSRLVILVLLFEVGYFFAVGSMWLESTIGYSVAAASGVANGGLVAQYIILFPIWGPLVLWWAKSRQAAAAA